MDGQIHGTKVALDTILITGASSGLGAALAFAYAAPGVTLILTARHEARLGEVASACRARGAEVVTALIDIREKEKLAAFIDAADDANPIDLVIANAGISAGSFAGNEFAAQIDTVFAVNLQGVLNTIHPLIPRMTARGNGQMAIMSSLAGIRALPGAPAYSASKAAVRFYGDALRGQLKTHGITVSVICPGWIATPLTAKNDFPMPFIHAPARAAALIKHNLALKKARIAFPRRIYYLLRFLDALPLFISDPLFAALPKKRLKS